MGVSTLPGKTSPTGVHHQSSYTVPSPVMPVVAWATATLNPGNANGSLQAAAPAGILSGDYILFFVFVGGSVITSTPSGTTLIGTGSNGGSINAQNATLLTANTYQMAYTGQAMPTFAFTSAINRGAVIYSCALRPSKPGATLTFTAVSGGSTAATGAVSATGVSSANLGGSPPGHLLQVGAWFSATSGQAPGALLTSPTLSGSYIEIADTVFPTAQQPATANALAATGITTMGVGPQVTGITNGGSWSWGTAQVLGASLVAVTDNSFATTADSVAVTSSIVQKGPWAQLFAATTSAARMLQLVSLVANIISSNNAGRYYCDIGVGPAGSEVVVAADIPLVSTNYYNSAAVAADPLRADILVPIPAGSRVAMRLYARSSSSPISFIAHLLD